MDGNAALRSPRASKVESFRWSFVDSADVGVGWSPARAQVLAPHLRTSL
jgi:hypothetical protein